LTLAVSILMLLAYGGTARSVVKSLTDLLRQTRKIKNQSVEKR
jgi:hypothetical protein